MPTPESFIHHYDQSSPQLDQRSGGFAEHEDLETLHGNIGRNIGDAAVKFAALERRGDNEVVSTLPVLTLDAEINQDHEVAPVSAIQQVTQRLQAQRDEFGRRYALGGHSALYYDSWRGMDYADVLTDPEAEASQIAELIQELRFSAEYEASTLKNELSTSYSDVLRIVDHIPEERLRNMYLSTKDSESGALRYLLGKIVSLDNQPLRQFQQPLKLLKKIYPADDALEVVMTHADDKVIDTIRSRSDYGQIMLNTMPSIGHDFSRDKHDLSGAQRDWAERYLQECVNLPESLADDFMFASFGRLSESKDKQPTNIVKEGKLYDSLSRVESLAREVGVEKLIALRDKAGIVNIDNYTPKQLNDTYKFISGDPEYIDKLHAGDTTLVLIDAKGDWNGGMASIPKVLNNPAANVLFFEVNRQSDPYRAFALCHRAQVRPSRVVIGAHGSPGNMWFGNKSEASNFVISNQLPSVGLEAGELYNQVVMPLMSAEGLARIADEYMQDSRGIDDNQELVGRRQIIIDSCSQAKPREVVRMVNGEQSVAQESTAETLAKVMSHTSVDIYAAATPVSSRATEAGFNYWDGESKAIHPATKMTIDEHGRIVTTTVDEIVLWRDSSKSEVA